MLRFFSDLYAYRALIVRLAKSQLALRYRQSILGLGWAVVQPLAQMLVFTLVLHKGANVPSEGNVPYALFVFTALLPWQLFASSLTFGVPSLVQFANVVRKVYVPRETFPLSSILTSFADFGLASIVIVVLLLAYRWPIHWTLVWVIPALLLQVVFTAGVLFFGSALCVKYRDIRHGVAFIVYLWMFIAPVTMPMEKLIQALARRSPVLPYVYVALNPIAVPLDVYRRALLHGQSPDWPYFGLASAVSVLLFVTGYAYFKRKEMTFADLI